MAKGRRWLGAIPRLTRRAWEDVAQQLEDYLRKLGESAADGIPPGFNNLLPQNVTGSTGGADLGDPGLENDGWASASHRHIAETGIAHALTPTSVNAEGSSPALARADHDHDTSALVDEAMIFAIIFGGK
jgi:hypothetical protein